MNHGELHVEDFKKVVEICKHHPRAHLDPLYHQIKNIMGDLDDIKDFIKSQWIDQPRQNARRFDGASRQCVSRL